MYHIALLRRSQEARANKFKDFSTVRRRTKISDRLDRIYRIYRIGRFVYPVHPVNPVEFLAVRRTQKFRVQRLSLSRESGAAVGWGGEGDAADGEIFYILVFEFKIAPLL